MKVKEGEVKVLVVGNGSVGKTSLIRQFCKGNFPEEYKKTIGVDFLEKTQYVKSLQEEVKLMLWDTAGQEEFDSMTKAYYRGAKAAVLCFSTTDRKSFESIKHWKKKIEEECGKISMVVVQNKVDLIDQAVITRHDFRLSHRTWLFYLVTGQMQEGEELAETLGLRFYRVCVKQNLYVTDVFEYLAELYLQKDCAKIMHTPRTLIGKPSMQNIREEIGMKKLDKADCYSENFEKLKKKKKKKRYPDCNIL
eukprot:Gb_06562 [translate_table: standard]